jgi:Na+-driven multidrug efflux pump
MDNFLDISLISTYIWITVPSTILFVLLMAGSFFGFGDELESDVTTDLDNIDDVSDGLPIFSLRNLVTFFTFLGWGGISTLRNGGTGLESIIYGTLSGVIMVFLMLGILYLFNKLRSDNTTKLSDGINTKGDVYLTIPKDGKGKVNITVNGSYLTVIASSENGEPIKTGSKIEVVDSTGTEVIVKQI